MQRGDEMASTRRISRKAKHRAAKPSPVLEGLERLVGEWDMEISNARFLPNPSDTVNGHASFEWLEDRGFFVIRMGGKLRSVPEAVWLIGRDESSQNYPVLYYDSRRVSRVYEMSFSEGVWKMWRESPTFWQRYEGKVSSDGNIITAHWEKSSDGAKWEHDFDITYTRVT